jgi:hypothetical protein
LVDPLKKAYKPFNNKISWSDFQNGLGALPEDKKWRFVRSSFLYQQALKCKKCNPNIAMSLLCSCAEALKLEGKNAGSQQNFKELYLKHCPTSLRTPPIEYHQNMSINPVTAPFDKALYYIYKRFRCLHLHEGIDRLHNLTVHGKTIHIGASLMDKLGNDAYAVDLLRILDWFLEITFNSLFDIL